MIQQRDVGLLSILNVGAGDLKIQFDRASADDVDKAKRMIGDMLKRGYILLIEDDDGKLRRVESFDPDKELYYISSPEELAANGITQDSDHATDTQATTTEAEPKKTRKSRKGVPLRGGKATAIAPTAGG